MLKMDKLEKIFEEIQNILDAKDEIRENVIKLSRQVVRNSSIAIKYIHEMNYEKALELMKKNESIIQEIIRTTVNHPEYFYWNFTLSALQEHVEAKIFFSIITDDLLPTWNDLNVPLYSYVLGLADVVGELRRSCVRDLKNRDLKSAVKKFEFMDELYTRLNLLTYPNALLSSLRPKIDVARILLERTESEVSLAISSERLSQKLESMEKKLDEHFKKN